MKIPFTIYDATTGAVLRTGSCVSIAYPLQAKAGEVIFEGKTGDTHWYNPVTEELEPLAANSVAMSNTVISLGMTVNLPAVTTPYTIIVDGVATDVNNEVVAITPTTVGIFSVEFLVPEMEVIVATLEVTL